MTIVIPSRGRASVIREKALRLFPDATLCVGDDDAAVYGRLSQNLLVHPKEVVGIGPLRQWILDNVDDRCIVMVDDDVTHVYSQVGFHKQRIGRQKGHQAKTMESQGDGEVLCRANSVFASVCLAQHFSRQPV